MITNKNNRIDKIIISYDAPEQHNVLWLHPKTKQLKMYHNDDWELLNTGGNSVNMVSVTHSELKVMRDNGELIPGMQYRITDYVATTKQAESQSAGHPFDIIVTANDNHTLSEDARAVQHEGDTYFSNCNLEAWKLKYCVDNDANRWFWATTDGKGVIYQMIDEHHNEMQYDFKGILFKRYKITACDKSPSLIGKLAAKISNPYITIDTTEHTWCYLFSNIVNGVVIDWSVSGNNSSKPDHCVSKSTGRTLSHTSSSTFYKLPNNVCVTDDSWLMTNEPKWFGWTCGDGCNNWTCNGGWCSNWTCEDGCKDWVCGEYCSNWKCCLNCYEWVCGNECSSWIGGPYNHKWVCGENCDHWETGAVCRNWQCNDGCSNWKCGDNCLDWVCENNCTQWKCGDYCQTWRCKKGSHRWIVENNCKNWTCDESCSDWTCATGVSYWTCGKNCSHWTALVGLWTCEDNCNYFTVYASAGETTPLPLTPNASYLQYVGKTSDGTLKTWNPADFIV